MFPEILCLGEPLYEFNFRPDGTTTEGFGGDISNCAVSVARQGIHAGILTNIGMDDIGDRFMSFWASEGITTIGVRQVAGAFTGSYDVRHTSAGHEFHYRRVGSASSMMKPEDLDHQLLSAARILHVSGISLAISDCAARTAMRAVEIARGSGVLVSVDPNYRESLWTVERASKITHAVMKSSDIALVGLEDSISMTGFDDPSRIAEFYLTLGARTVALTLGANGVLVADGRTTTHIPGHHVDPVDATGAGDTFDGAFLARFLRTGCAMESAKYANAAAAMSTTGFGATGPIPFRESVIAFLKQCAVK